jgi:hypothetical protein
MPAPDVPGAAQAFRTIRYRGGLDGACQSKQVVYGITSLQADQAGPADIAVPWGARRRPDGDELADADVAVLGVAGPFGSTALRPPG